MLLLQQPSIIPGFAFDHTSLYSNQELRARKTSLSNNVRQLWIKASASPVTRDAEMSPTATPLGMHVSSSPKQTPCVSGGTTPTARRRSASANVPRRPRDNQEGMCAVPAGGTATPKFVRPITPQNQIEFRGSPHTRDSGSSSSSATSSQPSGEKFPQSVAPPSTQTVLDDLDTDHHQTRTVVGKNACTVAAATCTRRVSPQVSSVSSDPGRREMEAVARAPLYFCCWSYDHLRCCLILVPTVIWLVIFVDSFKCFGTGITRGKISHNDNSSPETSGRAATRRCVCARIRC